MRPALLLVLAVSPTALAQSPSIEGPPGPVDVKEPVWLRIVNVPEESSAIFLPNDSLQTGPPHITPLSALFYSTTTGEFQIYALVVDWTNHTLLPLSFKITVGEPEPPPPPPPPPSKELEGVMFYKGEDLDNNLRVAQMVVSQRLREVKDFTWRPYEIDTIKTTDENLYPWVELVEGNGWPLPYLLLINENGDLVAHDKATTIDDAIKLVKEHLP